MQRVSTAFVVGGWGRQMSGGLVGDYSQREVLPLGPLSVHKYQRYALIFLNFQTLRRKRKETNVFWATTCAKHCVRHLCIPDLIYSPQ